MILTHGANSLTRGGDDPDVIGGRKYRTVTIGNQVWLAENLDFKFPGLVVRASGTSYSEPRGNYYNNDESTYGFNGNKYGLLYNWAAVTYLNDHRANLIPGWHVPTSAEWDALGMAVGGLSVAGTKLKSTTDWSSGAGTDDYGFSAFPVGRYNGSFDHRGYYTAFWTPLSYSGNEGFYEYFNTTSNLLGYNSTRNNQYSVRLVKDA